MLTFVLNKKDNQKHVKSFFCECERLLDIPKTYYDKVLRPLTVVKTCKYIR